MDITYLYAYLKAVEVFRKYLKPKKEFRND